MMATEFGSGDFLDYYRSITNKLKKRFLRKPNLTEACEEFSSLGQRCESLNLKPQAGLCWLAAARCEGSLANMTGEAGCLIRAGRQFLSAENKLKKLGCDSLGREHLQAAISCYSHASTRYPENSPLPNGLWIELASAVENDSDCIEFAEQLYTQAATSGSLLGDMKFRITCLQRVVSYKIKQKDFTGALSVLTDIVTLLDSIAISTPHLLELYTDIRYDCEILRVILLLILRPTPQRLAPPLARILEKYTWGNCDDKSVEESGIGEELFILIKSLVMACQASDNQALPLLEADLRPHLNVEQQSLLRTLPSYCAMATKVIEYIKKNCYNQIQEVVVEITN